MGNCTSFAGQFSISGHKTAKIVDSKGNLRQVKVPMKAAELMLEQPGHVVSSVKDLRRSSRVVAMKADDELLAGDLYLVVSLSRVHSKISEVEIIGIIESAIANEKTKKRTSKKRRATAKVLPAAPVDLEEEEEGDAEAAEQEEGFGATGFSGSRSERCRYWAPTLEPISEEL